MSRVHPSAMHSSTRQPIYIALIISFTRTLVPYSFLDLRGKMAAAKLTGNRSKATYFEMLSGVRCLHYLSGNDYCMLRASMPRLNRAWCVLIDGYTVGSETIRELNLTRGFSWIWIRLTSVSIFLRQQHYSILCIRLQSARCLYNLYLTVTR
jgi:hypothetical protein